MKNDTLTGHISRIRADNRNRDKIDKATNRIGCKTESSKTPNDFSSTADSLLATSKSAHAAV